MYQRLLELLEPHQAKGFAQQTPDARQLGQGTARPTSPIAPVQLSSRKHLAVPVLNGLHHA
jgi:hypothetical protein